ncbi:MAG TPA: HAMP domain-containing protein [Kofleriaceae bacterium]|nr:HAMP domain-containing protein [Kofleriaceae bacterium]
MLSHTKATDSTPKLLAVLRALKAGDFSVRMPIRGNGIDGKIARTLNEVIELNEEMARELERLNTAVGKEGKLGQRMALGDACGGWRSCVDSVNGLIGDLVMPTTDVGRVIGAVASGDLSQTMTLELDGRPLRGEFLRTAKVVNGMVEQLGSFAAEVTRVAREVGTEGKLGGQAQVEGVAGTWKDLTDNVNLMAGNLTAQVRNIAEVTIAVARGDLSKKITVDVKGEILQLKTTINTMVDQLNSFASEVTRVAREVGTEGKLGGQAEVKGVAGTWKDLTDNVNSMASNLTSQVRNIAEVTTAVANGDLSKKISVDVKGEILQLKNTINTMVDQLNAFASEVTRVAREVGTEGKLGGQGHVKGVAGTWKDLTDNVNSMASNLTSQVRNIAEVTTAVANGDLSKKITVDVKGEILQLKNTINTMVDQLNAFASEVTRVAREVGTEGKLGGQAQVRGVAGTWKDLTDNVNSMASNLTNQVRGIAKVVTAVAGGDLKRKLALEARGEIAELADTINSMTDTLALFADQVTTVAREVGVEGKLGGQAKVPGAAGTWRALTDNVNQLAGNLTTQVRAIADVATAVTKGDLTRSISVEASGEVAALKENINEMIRNLKDTTQKTTEQDWLKTNLAKFTRMLQGQRDLVTVAQQILSELAPLVSAQHGVFYLSERESESREITLKLLASYGYRQREHVPTKFKLKEGLIGQCAFEKRKIVLAHVPGDYIQISSGLGEAKPLSILILPVLFEGEVNAVIELASFDRLSEIHEVFLDQLTESIGIVVNTIAAGMRTESLLKQSQSLTQELQSQQEELRETNERLENQATSLRESEDRLRQQQEELRRTNDQLGEKAKLLEVKNREVELAKEELEEKAEQLALTSKYKSQFLANMSHELRTPLNSLLILSKMLADNTDRNLHPKQVEFANTIHAAGTDLLALISDILDLSKIESGTISIEPSAVAFSDLREYLEQNFRHIAQEKRLEFGIQLHPGLPGAIATDAKRLQQVLKNLLSNAFKFTDHGRVALDIRVAVEGWSRDHRLLDEADTVIAFAVTDTGIGIPADKHRIIFEAFQQADGTTSRRYGGTGLGLSISREIARILGGEIRVQSVPEEGSTFTLYLPKQYIPVDGGHIEPGARVLLSVKDVDSPERLLDETARCLHRTEAGLSEPQRRLLRELPTNPSLEGTTVLVVDDDVRNIFAITSVLEAHHANVVSAENGRDGLRMLESTHVDIILMDVMMPDMDGYTVMRKIRAEPRFASIPIIAVTAKAMKADREKCIQAGASDYIAKPVDLDTLLLLLRMWLSN